VLKHHWAALVTLVDILDSLSNKTSNFGTLQVGTASYKNVTPILAEMASNKVLKILQKMHSQYICRFKDLYERIDDGWTKKFTCFIVCHSGTHTPMAVAVAKLLLFSEGSGYQNKLG
jgi:hypothetical protein